MVDMKATEVVGLVGLYDSQEDLIRAASTVRDAGFRNWDCHSPYPVHGLARAMGLKHSPVGRICLTAGFVGAALAMLMQWWMNAIDYPVAIGGKPLFSWPAFVPITFAMFVLFAAIAAMACIVIFCKLGRWHSPLHDTGIMARITSDRFAVVLAADDERFTASSARELLEQTGCGDIRELVEFVEEDISIL